MSTGEPSEWRDALAAELRTVEARISELEWQKRTRAQLEATLRAGREARRLDRERAIHALGRPTRAIGTCADATSEVAARPRRCPGCGVEVVDPRGLDASEVAARLGSSGPWLARSDGLLALRACVREKAPRRLERALATLCGCVLAIAYVATLWLASGR